jgi:hypothetical protein
MDLEESPPEPAIAVSVGSGGFGGCEVVQISSRLLTENRTEPHRNSGPPGCGTIITSSASSAVLQLVFSRLLGSSSAEVKRN